jgi:hypothetical protein
MDGAEYTVSIATTISIGVSLLAGFISVLVAMRASKAAAAKHDIVVSVLCVMALLMMLLIGVAAALIAGWGMGYIELLRGALLLTAAFAVVGMACGLTQGLRSGRAIKTRSA